MRRSANVLLAGALIFGAGCGSDEAKSPHPETDLTATELNKISQTAFIRPGESVYTKAGESSDVRDRIVGKLSMIDQQYAHGFSDSNAPTVNGTPIRIKTKADIDAGDNSVHVGDDLVCDTLNVDASDFPDVGKVYMGALQINWPKNPDGTQGKLATVCFERNHEPDQGAVLYLTDQPR
jgi:hypothetical protein